MNINKLKKIIIILIIILTILGIGITIMIILNNNNHEENNESIEFSELEEASDRIISEEGKIESVNSFKLFYNVDNCADTYVQNVKSANNEIVYKLLSTEYITKNNITKEKVLDNVDKIDNEELLYTKKMYQQSWGDDANHYIYIEGLLRKTSDNILHERSIFLTVIINSDTQTFSIIPGKSNFPEELQNLEEVDKKFEILDIKTENKKIENNTQTGNENEEIVGKRTGGKAEGYSDEKEYDIETVNIYQEQDVSNDYIARAYLIDYTTNLKYYGKNLYSNLDEAYRNERFGNINKFEEYINEISSNINNISLKSYVINDYDDYTEYVCIDRYGNYYIFDATSVMNYTIKLDNYTIQSDTYKESYAKLRNEEKVAANVATFISMINTKDYSHIYNILDDTFRKNNFATVDVLKKYIQQNFLNCNINSSNISVKASGNYYVYTSTIKENNTSTGQSKNLTIIMQLKEGTDFVMSFNVETGGKNESN